MNINIVDEYQAGWEACERSVYSGGYLQSYVGFDPALVTWCLGYNSARAAYASRGWPRKDDRQ